MAWFIRAWPCLWVRAPGQRRAPGRSRSRSSAVGRSRAAHPCSASAAPLRRRHVTARRMRIHRTGHPRHHAQGKRDGTTKDEPFAWESREFLRKKLIGQARLGGGTLAVCTS